MSFEELKQQFIDNGFQVNGNSFILNQVSYSTMIINGVPHQQPQHHKFKMEYVFEGSICDAGDSETEPLYQFDVLDDNGNKVLGILIDDFDSFTKLVG